MSPPLLAAALSSDDITRLKFIGAGLIVLVVFIVASRVLAQFIGNQLRNRAVRADMVVLGRRVVYVIVIGFGLLGAFTLAFQTANVTLVGILIATVIAALGVQDLLRDYVSGYYVLLERHVRVGDRIEFDGKTGSVTDVRLRVTLLRSESGDLIVVPNSELFTKPVTIFTRTPEEVAGGAASSTPPG